VLKTDIESEPRPTDRAITIGLILNELVTNAVKYAFPGDTKTTILVTLKRVLGELHLTVANNGQGLDLRRADSGLGHRPVEGFAQQLGGQLKRQNATAYRREHFEITSAELQIPLRFASQARSLSEEREHVSK
jgi:two-component sensor histidine kinase